MDDSVREAAEAYSPTRDQPLSDHAFRLELEIAFISGAQWYNERSQEHLRQRIAELEREAVNARS